MGNLLEGKTFERKNINTKRNIYLFISSLIGLLLIAPDNIAWARDRLNYLGYADSSWIIMQRYLDEGIFAFLSNEPLFLAINIVLSTMFSSEEVLKIIIFASTLGVLFSLGKITNYNFLVFLFFLILPQLVKNHIIHLRQGMALSIYLIGLVNTKKYRVIRYLSVFIHSSFIFVVLFEFLEGALRKVKISFSVRLLFSSFLLTAFILAIPTIAAVFEDRRASVYSFKLAESASGLGFLLWLIMGILFIFVIKKSYINIIACYGIVFYLVSYFLLDFTARIFENIIPLILIAVLTSDKKEVRILYSAFLLVYGAMFWYLEGKNYFIE